jgi:hypothetical protein
MLAARRTGLAAGFDDAGNVYSRRACLTDLQWEL